jgi:hypothetical protein
MKGLCFNHILCVCFRRHQRSIYLLVERRIPRPKSRQRHQSDNEHRCWQFLLETLQQYKPVSHTLICPLLSTQTTNTSLCVPFVTY